MGGEEGEEGQWGEVRGQRSSGLPGPCSAAPPPLHTTEAAPPPRLDSPRRDSPPHLLVARHTDSEPSPALQPTSPWLLPGFPPFTVSLAEGVSGLHFLSSHSLRIPSSQSDCHRTTPAQRLLPSRRPTGSLSCWSPSQFCPRLPRLGRGPLGALFLPLLRLGPRPCSASRSPAPECWAVPGPLHALLLSLDKLICSLQVASLHGCRQLVSRPASPLNWTLPSRQATAPRRI